MLESVNMRKTCSKLHVRLLLWPKLPTYFNDVTTIENNRQVNVAATLVAIFRIGPRNRHWGAFAESARYGTIWRGRSQSCIVLERCTFGQVSRMQFILFLCVFISDGALTWGWCQKFVSGLIIMGIWRMRRLLGRGLEVVPVIIMESKSEQLITNCLNEREENANENMWIWL